MITSIQAHDILAIIHSTHQSPHHILGMHTVNIKWEGETRTVPSVRAFVPDAKQLLVVNEEDGKEIEMDQIHSDGLFEAIFWNKKDPFNYHFRVIGYSGQEWTMEDSYKEWVEEITPFDRYLFNRSQHYKIYEKMGAHVKTVSGKNGVYFSVWAPGAQRVSVIGNFNGWDGRKAVMEKLADSGVWAIFVPGVKERDAYKYEIKTRDGRLLEKADPYATMAELRPKTASIVYKLEGYEWRDQKWMEKRQKTDFLNQAVSIYEVHAGSWKRIPEEGNRFLTYRELADDLLPYVKEMGFTHIELMPIEEHPFDGSWGYQVTGYFAPSSRFGEPKDLQYFINKCHRAGIGVILDWVPGHFPKDPHGLVEFDGGPLYEYADPRKGEHMDWGTKVFDYGRQEVKNFLIANAMYWIDKFHFDGLRVDAVASILYLDYSRTEWIPNIHGGRENLEAIEFIQHMNSMIYQYYPGILMIAEESTSFPGVSRPTYVGGLGFGFKWNMGWMHDTLNYMKLDSVFRKYHHGELTFSFIYAWTENFILPISHDEVVHGKGSMINKMPGDYWQKFANLRAFYTYMWTHPGKQLLFMGQEFAQFEEWSENRSLDWHLLDYDFHKGMRECITDLNKLYKKEKALWEQDFIPEGFEGINLDDPDNSIISFIRRGKRPKDYLIILINFTPVVRENYRIGVPEKCEYREIFNSDSEKYQGSNFHNFGSLKPETQEFNGKPFSVGVNIPPLAAIILKPDRKRTKKSVKV